ncbi:MAG: hypothetical protein HKN12_11025, partial [Gemmatimonadetes bacterium]|nr:hypothetical protein [Gemmatimonadota bacterium]
VLLGAALLSMSLVLIAAAEPLPGSAQAPWDIISKSTTLQKGPDGSRIVSFIDDVTIKHGELIATADRARYLEASRRAILDGHVVMWQDSTIVRGPYTYYERNTGVARFPYGVVIERQSGTAVADQGIWRKEENRFELRGDASAADTTGTLDAQAMTYDMNQEIFYAVGDARMVDDVTGVVVEGQNIKYDRAEAQAVVTGEPIAVFTDDDGYDIRVRSEKMIYDPLTKEATAERNVRVRRETMTATAGRAHFYRAEDRAVLTESPEMVDGATAIRGDRIEMLSPGPGRRTVKVFGAAVVANTFLEDRPGPVSADELDGPDPGGPAAGGVDGDAPGNAADGSRVSRDPLPAQDADARVKLRKSRDRVQAAIDLVKDAAGAPTGADTASTAVPEIPEGAETAAAVVEGALAEADSAAAASDSAAADSTASDSTATDVPAWLQVPSDQLPTENLLFGDEITLYFVDNELDQVVVVGHGRSKFFPSEEDGVLSEWNDVVGDTLYVWFTESDLDSVHVAGNGAGEYRFPADGLAGASVDVLRSNGKLVDYEAPVIRYMRTSETMHLEGGAKVLYKTMNLTSGTIDFDAAREIMTASGNPPPVLIDREDEIHGAAMNYHLPSGKGEIVQGKTRFEAGYYSGKDIWKLGEEELGVDHAIYTTCDHDDPHYHFSCRHMKIYLDDKMVARPVVLKIRNIPVFALPFYMTSLRKDRHSGFLLPNLELGVDDARGRFIRNLGYYWAPNDYMDLTGTVDFYPARDQFVGYLDTRYNVRYRYSGSVGLKYNRDASTDRKQTAVEIRHEHTLSETARLTANASFLSSNSIYQEIDDSNRLDRDLSSHATFTKRFEGSRSLRVEARRNENLDNGSFTETLPSIVLTSPSKALTGGNSNDPVIPGEERKARFTDNIYYKTDLRAVSQRRRDTLGAEERNTGSTVDARLNTTQNILRYLRITPNFNSEATWIDKDELGDKNQLRATYNGSLTARTDVY